MESKPEIPWPSTGAIDRAVVAVEELRESRREQARQISRDLFGHPGAHIGNGPTLREEIACALRAIRAR